MSKIETVVGQPVLYELTKKQAKESGYDTLPAVVLFRHDDGTVDLEVQGAVGYLEAVAHQSTVAKGQSTEGTFKLSND